MFLPMENTISVIYAAKYLSTGENLFPKILLHVDFLSSPYESLCHQNMDKSGDLN